MARGSIFKRNDKYVIIYRDQSGKRHWKTIGTNKKEAEKALAAGMREIHREEHSLPREIPFKDFADMWLSDYAEPRVKPSTFKFYRDIIRLHLIPYFKAKKLKDIKAHDVDAYLAARKNEGTLSPTTVGHHLRVLKMVLRQAVVWGYLIKNPAQYIKRPRPEKQEVEFLTPADLKKFLEYTSKEYYPFFLTAALTGMRRAELFGLKWGDINWETFQIHVRRSFVLGKFEEPKSKSAIRAITMSPILFSTLNKHRLSCPPSEYDLVFSNQVGNPLNGPNMLTREFFPALRRAGLRKIRFHDLRHTHASILIAQGENIKFIQEQLGHSSVQMTIDKYGHLLPSISYGTEKRLQKMIFGE